VILRHGAIAVAGPPTGPVSAAQCPAAADARSGDTPAQLALRPSAEDARADRHTTRVRETSPTLDTTRRIARRAFTTDDDGFALVPWPLTHVPVDARFDAQAIVRGTSVCGGVARCASMQGLGMQVR